MGNSQTVEENLTISPINKLKEIKFYLHDQQHAVKKEDIDPNTSLNFYLRNVLKMTGTKGMCFEGGCGACVVVIQKKNPDTQKEVFLAVNSCLVPLLSCNGWRIYTIEGIGNPLMGYHPVQEILARFNGTQCGFCSPGMVMNMYALYESGKFTMEQVENSFSGNICRCTGYRSILSAFKSLSKDANKEILGEYPDIEDFVFCSKQQCINEEIVNTKQIFYTELSASTWFKVFTLKDLLKTIKIHKELTYKLIAGNTAQGVYADYRQNADTYIDISEVSDLRESNNIGQKLVVGASMTLTETIKLFNETSQQHPQFAYLKSMADHIDLIANVPVRNRGTLAGNLMMKHDHSEFPSDIFLILETVAAILTVVDPDGKETELSTTDFLNYSMKFMVLKCVTLVSYPNTIKYIMPRAQNTHAHVNAGFLFNFYNTDNLESVRIVYGNINPSFIHARQSETFLKGKNLFDDSVLQQVYKLLAQEVQAVVMPPDPSPQFRNQLAIALFYKAVLSIAPAKRLAISNKSGGERLQRPVSKGAQDFETNKSLYPLTQPISKMDALAQTSGQANYVVDLPDMPNQLYSRLVLAKAPANAVITKIDSSKALAINGVVAFFSASDIPGVNIYTTPMTLINVSEELFCSGTVKYYEQPIGILVGTTQKAVDDALDLVKVVYKSSNVQPLTSIRDVLKAGRTDRVNNYKTITAKRKGTDVKNVVKGSFDLHPQYHFHMETHACQVIPNEDGLDVYCSTQWMDMVQLGIAKVVKIPQNKVNVHVRRCGGAFGGKLTRAGLPACAVALAAYKLRKPVRIWMTLTANMAAIGKRFPFSCDYEIGVNSKGEVQYLNGDLYTDVGYQYGSNISTWIEDAFASLYTFDTYTLRLNRVTTDVAANTWARAPGSLEGVSAIECLMEHISYVAGIDPLQVRLANFIKTKTDIVKHLTDLQTWANIEKRKTEIATFNQQNRWKKKGLSIVPMEFPIDLLGPYVSAVSIFHSDGSVQVTHGGVEMGQGLNTKVAQACAYTLGIALEQVLVMPSNSFSGANSLTTGGSIGSEGATIQACNQLLNRLKPFQTKGAKWEDVVAQAHQKFVNLTASGIYPPPTPADIASYKVYGVCATEVLVDILTGQHLVTRVDLIEDTGRAISPVIDIGQVEGAFVMGIGYFTTEKIVYSYEGKVLTNNTWTYLPPGAKDIPIEFNVKFPKGNPNPVGVLKSKATGEPPICLSVSVILAIRNAVASARTDASASNTKWFPVSGTTDIENVFLNSSNSATQYRL